MAPIFHVTATCCVALEFSKASWVIAFAPPGDTKVAVYKIKGGDVDRLLDILDSSKTKAERQLGRPLQIVLCYEVGYDGFWLARLLIKRGIKTVVFDPASFLFPRRGRVAKTDRLDRRHDANFARLACGQSGGGA